MEEGQCCEFGGRNSYGGSASRASGGVAEFAPGEGLSERETPRSRWGGGLPRNGELQRTHGELAEGGGDVGEEGVVLPAATTHPLPGAPPLGFRAPLCRVCTSATWRPIRETTAAPGSPPHGPLVCVAAWESLP